MLYLFLLTFVTLCGAVTLLIHQRRDSVDHAKRLGQHSLSLQQNLDSAMHDATHRMRNNLQLISSMIGLEMRRIADGSKTGDRAVFRAMQARVDILAFVDGMIFENAPKLQVDIHTFLEAVRDYLSSRYDRVALSLNIDVDGKADIPTARALAFIVNELVGACAASRPTLQQKLAAIETIYSDDELIFKIHAQRVDCTRLQIGTILAKDCVIQLGGRFLTDPESQTMEAATWRIELPHSVMRCVCSSPTRMGS